LRQLGERISLNKKPEKYEARKGIAKENSDKANKGAIERSNFETKPQ